MRDVKDREWTGGAFTPHAVTHVVEQTSEQVLDMVDGIPLYPQAPNMPDLLVSTAQNIK